MKQLDPNSTAFATLRILADGRRYSGADLAQRLDLSRAAIWKSVQKLVEMGLPISAQRGRGYQLKPAIELLSASVIQRTIAPNTRALCPAITVTPVTDSTNSVLMSEHCLDPAVLFTEWQTAGRGRHHRPWHSQFGSGILFSVRWQFDCDPGELSGLSLACGVVVVKALAHYGLDCAQLKWPNDVLVNHKKLAGILVEMIAAANSRTTVVIGIGVNTAIDPSRPTHIDQEWCDVYSITGKAVARNRLAGLLLDALITTLDEFSRTGFITFAQAWQQYHALAGTMVRVQHGQTEIDGMAIGVNNQGALIIEKKDGTHRALHSGEVQSLRRST